MRKGRDQYLLYVAHETLKVERRRGVRKGCGYDVHHKNAGQHKVDIGRPGDSVYPLAYDLSEDKDIQERGNPRRYKRLRGNANSTLDLAAAKRI
jgi:hypothetical protein